MSVPPVVAVLGGGITGLSAAFHLSRTLPASASIILFEKQDRLGGWIHSERVAEHDVVLEKGPRTLRPNSKALLELINLLDLKSKTIKIPSSDPSARSRYLYLPPLTSIPSSPLSVMFSSVTRKLFPSITKEPFLPRNRPSGIDDESVDSFISRRFSPEIARQFGSAIVHGIYAADSRKLSLRSTFPSLWDAEDRGKGSVLRGFLLPRRRPPSQLFSNIPYSLEGVDKDMAGISVYSFKNGVQTITESLERYLSAQPNVTIHKNISIDSISAGAIVTSNGPYPISATHIISTLPLHSLSSLVPSLSIPPLPYSTVHVLNLLFPETSTPLHPPGFGYLVPRPSTDYPSEGSTTPEQAILGTIFDSSISQTQSKFTQMTLMLGGPYQLSPTSLASFSLSSILQTLRTQLSLRRPLPDPILHRLTTHKSCIPTYPVNHLQRMVQFRDELTKMGGWLDVAGAGTGEGVGVGDCVESGRKAALRISMRTDGH